MRRSGLRAGLVTACAATTLCGLAACDSKTREQIGIERSPPDEFAVLTHAPLTIPPDFGLRPPAPGARRPQEQEITDQARSILLRGARTAARDNAAPTRGEQVLLGRAGAAETDPSIRGTVDQESAQIAGAGRSFVDRLVFWRDPDPAGEVLDAERESQRLRSNAALGRPVTSGATPVIERRERGILEGIFN